MHHEALSEEELNTLGYYLEEEAQERDALDFFATHGLMTALSINPQPNDFNILWSLIFEQPPIFENTEQENTIKAILLKLWHEIDSLLSEAEEFPVPCELTVEVEDDEEIAPLESWAQGFMEGLMYQQDSWFKNKEAEIAEQLLPIHYASGFFSDEPEMQEIDNNLELSKQVCEALPSAVTDLYLAFRV
jgi:uncharacterized protein